MKNSRRITKYTIFSTTIMVIHEKEIEDKFAMYCILTERIPAAYNNTQH